MVREIRPYKMVPPLLNKHAYTALMGYTWAIQIRLDVIVEGNREEDSDMLVGGA